MLLERFAVWDCVAVGLVARGRKYSCKANVLRRMENNVCAIGIIEHRLDGYRHNASLCAAGRNLYTLIRRQMNLLIRCFET